MHRSHRIVLLIALALSSAACKREQPAPVAMPEARPPAATAAAAPAEQATIPGTDAISVTENTSAEAGVQPVVHTIAGLDSKAFAGTFSTEGASVVLAADGTYAMTVHAASANADLESHGTWTAEDDGKRIALDSDDKSEPDRRYVVVAQDELKAENGDQVLRRETAR